MTETQCIRCGDAIPVGHACLINANGAVACCGCEGKPEGTSWLAELSLELHTQDNRITADPLFCVQQQRTVWGMAEGYSDDFKWFDANDPESHYEEDEIYAEIREHHGIDECLDLQIDPEDFGYKKVYFKRYWDFVTAHFTEKAADRYLQENAHNLDNPRVFVTSQYRCDEWNRVRKFLMGEQR